MKEDIENSLNELKMLMNIPKLYLANYFIDLKTQVDLKYFNQEKFKDKYKKIINRIESFEQECYKNNKSKKRDKFESIEIQINNINNLDEAKKLIQIEKYSAEKELFQNKTIYFLDFILFIINDEYISKNVMDSIQLTNSNNNNNSQFYFTDSNFQDISITNKLNRETINKIYLLKSKLNQIKLDHIIVDINLNINFLTELNLNENQLTSIDLNSFIDLNNLTILHLNHNRLKFLK